METAGLSRNSPATAEGTGNAVARPASPSGLAKLVILLAIATGVLLTVHLTPLGELRGDLHGLRERIDGTGLRNEAKFAAIAAVLMALGAPRLAFFALAGLLFGVLEGFLAAMTASLASSYTTFRLIRWVGRDWVASRFGQNRFFRRVTGIRPTLLSVFLVRQLPVSNVFLNATLALSTVGDRAFVLGSLLGFAPQGVIALLIGDGVSTRILQQGVIHLILAATGIAGLGLWIWIRSRREQRTGRETRR